MYLLLTLLLLALFPSISSAETASVAEAENKAYFPAQFDLSKANTRDDSINLFIKKYQEESTKNDKFIIKDTSLEFSFEYSVGACNDIKIIPGRSGDTLVVRHTILNRATCYRHIQTYTAKGMVKNWPGKSVSVKIDVYDIEKFSYSLGVEKIENDRIISK